MHYIVGLIYCPLRFILVKVHPAKMTLHNLCIKLPSGMLNVLEVDQHVNKYSDYLQVLASQAHPDGGWGYNPGQAAQLEPTCLALLALSLEADKYKSQIDQGRQFLEGGLAADGSYRLANGREEAVSPTSLALFVPTLLGKSNETTRHRLLAVRGKVPGKFEGSERAD